MPDNDWLDKLNPLIYRIQRQDKLALQILYDLSAARLLANIMRIVHHQYDAEDILQEVFIKVWQQAHKYTGTGSAWGWLCVLARHTAIDRLRHLRAHPYESTDDTPELLNQLMTANDDVTQHSITRCLEQLKPQAQQAILLSYVHGYSHGELTTKLATPLGTIKAWIRRGLGELKQCLVA